MLHRLTTLLLLAIYSVTALSGQGLHLLAADCGCCSAEVEANSAEQAAVCTHSHRCGHAHHQAAKKSQALTSAVPKSHGDQLTVEKQSPAGGHDCEHCAICQHQSLGQMLALPAGAGTSAIVVEFVRPLSAESALSVEYFSLAQPRAPPTV